MEEIIELEPLPTKGYFLGQCYIILGMVGGALNILGGIIGLGRCAFGGGSLLASLLALSMGIFWIFVGRALWRKQRFGLYSLYILLAFGLLGGLATLPWGIFAAILTVLWFAYFYRRRAWFR